MKLFLAIIVLFAIFVPVSVLRSQGIEVEKPPGAGLTPDSPFYIFDLIQEKVSLLFTPSSKAKAEKALRYAQEKFAEIRAMSDKLKTEEVQKAVEKYEEHLNVAVERGEEAKAKGQDTEELMEHISTVTFKNQQILDEVIEKAPLIAKEALERAKEVSKRGFNRAIQAISKRLQEEIEKKKEEIKEEIKKEIKEEAGKIQEQLKQDVGKIGQEAKEGILERLGSIKEWFDNKLNPAPTY